MLYFREDSGQDEGLRALQGFLLALPLHSDLQANWEPQPQATSSALQLRQNDF